MKAAQVEIGGVYLAMVSGRVVPVEVERMGKTDWHKYPHTYYLCRSLLTGREVRVNSVTRFRRRATKTECACAAAEREE